MFSKNKKKRKQLTREAQRIFKISDKSLMQRGGEDRDLGEGDLIRGRSEEFFEVF